MTDANDDIAQAEARMKQLREQLTASPVVDVLGVVSPSGVGGGRVPPEELWTLRFTFDAWRVQGGKLQTKALNIQRQVTDEELRRFQDALEPYMVVRIKAHVLENSVLGLPQALLEKVIGVDTSDPELNDKAAELQKPVTFSDPTLGTFTLDRRVSWFTTKPVWLGNPISLSLSATEPEEIQNALKTAHTLWDAQKTWAQRIDDYAAEELLSLKNESWLGKEESELTPDQFKARMTLDAITIYPDGSFEFWHDDGDLFCGHAIQVSGDIVNGLTDAGIHG